MDERFAKLEDQLLAIISSYPVEAEIVSANALLKTWKQLSDSGIEGYDFAHVALLMAECVMTFYEPLDENIKFGEHLKTAGSCKIRCVSKHWPPVDPALWPTNFPRNILRD